MPRRRLHAAALLAPVLLVILILVTGALITDPASYSALAGAIQAAFVAPTLLVAAITLVKDSWNRRIDRVYGLHQELTTGDVGRARTRLGAYLRSLGSGYELNAVSDPQRLNAKTDKVRRIRPRDLREAPLNISEKDEEDRTARPRQDLSLLLRFFERAEASRQGKAVDDAAFCALIGRHAVWWDDAIDNVDTTSRRPLERLARWTDEYAAKHPEDPGLEKWGQARREDFASLYPNGERTLPWKSRRQQGDIAP